MNKGWIVLALLVVVLACLLAGCTSARDRAEGYAIRQASDVQATATIQPVQAQQTRTALEVDEAERSQDARIVNRINREWWLNTTLIVSLTALAGVGTLLLARWGAGEVRARREQALAQARSLHPDPRTGALPILRAELAPGRVARLLHEAAPLIRLLSPGFEPTPLHYATTYTDLDSGATFQVRQVMDGRGRLHVWQEAHLGPAGQHALAHHTRRVVLLGQAMTGMKQGAVAGEIASHVPALGHMPVFEPADARPDEQPLLASGGQA